MRAPNRTPYRHLSPAEQDSITALAEKGWGAKRISSVVGRHESAVQWFLYRTGLRAPAYGNSVAHVRANGRPVKPFSPAEDEIIQDLRLDGVAVAEIARRITAAFGHPRSTCTVRNRLVMLAAREETAA